MSGVGWWILQNILVIILETRPIDWVNIFEEFFLNLKVLLLLLFKFVVPVCKEMKSIMNPSSVGISLIKVRWD